MNLPLTQTVAERFGLILEGLGRAVAARIAGGAMAAAMIVLVWTRIRRIEGKVQRLLALFQAGRLRVVAGPRQGRGSSGGKAAAGRLPLRFGWLLAMVPHQAACFAGQLRTVLGEPEMVALLEASPQARRVLGPLCRMLGVERSVLRVEPVEGAKRAAGEAVPVVPKRVRVAAVPVEPWRIPLPRGVLSAARRQGYGKR
jgi:hypothetical protein